MRKGISPAVSYVLLLALIVIMSVAAYLWGDYEVRRLQDTPIAHNMESQMISVDELVQAAAHGDVNFTTTMNLYYTKGVVEVDAANGWIKYTAEINALAYEKTEGGNESCDRDLNPGTYILSDPSTGVTMTKMDEYTNVFRGGTEYDQRQLVEIVACFPDIRVEQVASCVGKSGPRAQLTVRKTGFDNSIAPGKPVVEVSIC
jgi:hypothetical protein